MGATNLIASGSSQWIYSTSGLHATPSKTTSGIPLQKEMYDRARGVEFLFRLGVSLSMPSSAMYTAATWFHRFFMRFSMEDYHRQEVAAACIFLATKTEECGRKLRDVAKVYWSKVGKVDIKELADDAKDIEESMTMILLTEEVLLEALCFDFVVESPHTALVELLEARDESEELEDYAWTIANDSYRTPLCLLYPPRIIAAASYVLAQHIVDSSTTTSLADRIGSPAPSASLPTPPSQIPNLPESSRFAVELFKFNEVEMSSVGEAITALLKFYAAQDLQGSSEYLSVLAVIIPPSPTSSWDKLYQPYSHVAQSFPPNPDGQLEHSPGGNRSPVKTPSHGRRPVKVDGITKDKVPERLDLS